MHFSLRSSESEVLRMASQLSDQSKALTQCFCGRVFSDWKSAYFVRNRGSYNTKFGLQATPKNEAPENLRNPVHCEEAFVVFIKKFRKRARSQRYRKDAHTKCIPIHTRKSQRELEDRRAWRGREPHGSHASLVVTINSIVFDLFVKRRSAATISHSDCNTIIAHNRILAIDHIFERMFSKFSSVLPANSPPDCRASDSRESQSADTHDKVKAWPFEKAAHFKTQLPG